MIDKKAKKILFRSYWKNGWIDEEDRQLSAADFAYAKSKGVMFDPLTISHDDCIKKILQLTKSLPVSRVAQAFVSSLSTNQVEWRSGLANYALAKQLRLHTYKDLSNGTFYDLQGNVTGHTHTCGTCQHTGHGYIIGKQHYKKIDLNVLNFERLKWGGVRHGQLAYMLFDLQQLALEDITIPTAEDIKILKAILKTIAQSKPKDHPGTLEKNLAKAIPSTKQQRQTVIEILAAAKVLLPKSYDRTGHSRSDWAFAFCWRGEDKYNTVAVQKYFGKYL